MAAAPIPDFAPRGDDEFARVIWGDIAARIQHAEGAERLRLISEGHRFVERLDMGLLGGPKPTDPKGPSENKPLGKHHGGNLHGNAKDKSTGKHGKPPADGKKK